MSLLIKNGTIVNGKGSPYISDVLVTDGRIKEIGPHLPAPDPRVTGLRVD